MAEGPVWTACLSEIRALHAANMTYNFADTGNAGLHGKLVHAKEASSVVQTFQQELES